MNIKILIDKILIEILKKELMILKNINFYSYESLQVYDFVVKDIVSKNLVNAKCEEDIFINNFNEITSIYKLLVKKYERDKSE